MPRFSIVVPVYNSEGSLELLYNRVVNVFDELYDKDFELILVDDSSKDGSSLIMHKLHQQDHRVKTIYLARNFGQHSATICGLNHCSGDIIITIDDDLQHPPEEIPRLIDYLDVHPDVDVVCGRYDAKKHSLIRNFGTDMTNKITSYIFKKPKNLKMTSFRAMRKYVVDALDMFSDARPRIGHMLLNTTNKIANVTIRHDVRNVGKSGYTFSRLIKDFTDNILYNSALPLELLGTIGAFSIVVSFLMTLYYLIRYFVSGYSVKGFATLIIFQLISSGLILFGLGIVGKYLIQIVSEAKKKPIYVIRKKEMNSND